MVTQLETARRQYVQEFTRDVMEHPECYKKKVREAPEIYAMHVIKGLTYEGVKLRIIDLRNESWFLSLLSDPSE